MADTMGHSATATRNTSVAIGFCLLALAPQLFELIWSIGTIFGWGAGRGPEGSVIGELRVRKRRNLERWHSHRLPFRLFCDTDH